MVWCGTLHHGTMPYRSIDSSAIQFITSCIWLFCAYASSALFTGTGFKDDLSHILEHARVPILLPNNIAIRDAGFATIKAGYIKQLLGLHTLFGFFEPGQMHFAANGTKVKQASLLVRANVERGMRNGVLYSCQHPWPWCSVMTDSAA